jgi:HAE1 family hydrophobic/amphiphilic exporter-1
LLLTGMMASMLPTEFMPQFVGGIYEAKIQLPMGSALSETAKVAQIAAKKMERFKDMDMMFMILGKTGDPRREAMMQGEQGTHQATFMIKFPKKIQGRVTTEPQLRQAWDELGRENPGVKFSLRSAGNIQMQSTKPIVVKVFGDDFPVLKRISDDLAAKMKEVNGLRDVTTTLEEGTPEKLVGSELAKRIYLGETFKL